MFGPLPQHMAQAFQAVKSTLSKLQSTLNSYVTEAKKPPDKGSKNPYRDIKNQANRIAQQINNAAAGAKKEVAAKAAQAREGAAELTDWGTRHVNTMTTSAHEKIKTASARVQQKVAQAGAAISREVDVARRTISGTAENVCDLRKVIYANVGYWGGQNSNFALVSGRYVVNCTWLSDGSRDLPKPQSDKDQKALDLINKFLDNGDRDHPPSADDYDTAIHTPLTDENELFVFVGDLHVHLFHLSPCDNFVCKAENGEVASLGAELKALIDHAKGLGLDKQHIIQVGDCFEVWESQILMNKACDLYVELVTGRMKREKKETQQIAAICRQAGLSLYERQPAPKSAEARGAFIEKCSPQLVADLLGLPCAVPASVKKDFEEKVKFTDPRSVEKSIKNFQKKLYRIDFDSDLTRILGNHDNGLKNKLLDDSIGGDASSGEPKTHKKGKDACIWFEHGDARDEFNRPQDFDKPNRGYAKTKDWVENEIDRAMGSIWGSLLWVGPQMGIKDSIATMGLKSYTRMRAAELRDTANSKGDASKPRVIILGHSHSPVVSFDNRIGEFALDGASEIASVVGERVSEAGKIL